MLRILFFFILFTSFQLIGQENYFLTQIEKLQAKNDSFYDEGLIPSQRFYANQEKGKEDNNIFFTALTVYTLQSIRNRFDNKDKIDFIIERAKRNYPSYKNRAGDITYNYWQVRPENPFPNSKFLSKRKKMRIADDFDDTAIIFLTQNNSDSLNKVLHQKMQAQSEKGKSKVKSTFKAYQKSKAYRTWFATKMKQDFDVCVQSNALLFVFEKQLELSKVDTATIVLIKDIILTDKHIESPVLVSPHYQNTSIILYHIARLIAAADNDLFKEIQSKVIQDIYAQLRIVDNEMEKVILYTSLFRLREKPEIKIDSNKLKDDLQNFYWFKASMVATSNIKIKKVIAKSKLVNFNYQSEGYYYALLLELESLTNSNKVPLDIIQTLGH